MQPKPHEPTIAIGYSLRICARHVNSTNPGRSNLVFRSKPIAEAEMSNRLITVSSGFWTLSPAPDVICVLLMDSNTHRKEHPSQIGSVENTYKQRRQSGLKSEGSWILGKKKSIFRGKFRFFHSISPKNSIFSRQIFCKCRFFRQFKKNRFSRQKLVIYR